MYICIYIYIHMYNIYVIYIYILSTSANEWQLCSPHQPMFNEVFEDRAHVVRER